MFQIKDFRSIIASMINVVRASQSQVTDFSVGSVARTIMEAPAIEIEELYLQMALGLSDSIKTAVFQSFSFTPIAAEGASGVVRFTAAGVSASAILVPAGTTVSTSSSSYKYATAIDVSIAPGGSYVDATVYCTSAGSATNVGAGLVTIMSSLVTGVASVSNALAFINGADAETDDARKTRFQWYVSTLSRGTVSSIGYGASQATVLNSSGGIIETAALVQVVEPYVTDSTQPIGLVNVFIHNGVGGTSSALLTNVTNIINGYYLSNGTPVPGWKSAGVHAVVAAATEVPIDVTATLTMLPGYTSAAADALATSLVGQYLLGLGIGVSAIRSEIIALIMSVPGVYNVVLSAPSADVSATSSQKVMPGTISIA